MAPAMEEELNEKKPVLVPIPIHNYPELLLPQPHPLLLISQGTFDRHTFFSISKNHYYRCRIPELINKHIFPCNGGWLVLKDYMTPECFLYNLVTKEKKLLPPLEDDNHIESCILTSPLDDVHNSSNCHVIFIKKNFYKYVVRCKVGGDDNDGFVKQDMKFEDEAMHTKSELLKMEDEPTLTTNGVVMCTAFCRGKLYALTMTMDRRRSRTLQVADLHLLLFTSVAQVPRTREIGVREDFLVECCDELLFVQKNYREVTRSESRKVVFEFLVFRMDFTKAMWEKVDDLGNLTLFLSGSKRCNFGFIVKETDTGIKHNSIYFTEPEDRNLYRYDMEEQSITSYLPDPKVDQFSPITSWIVLN